MALGLFMLFTLHPLLFLSHSGILQADLITWALGMATARFYRSTVAPWFTCLFSRAPSLGKRPTVYSQICLCFTQIFFFFQLYIVYFRNKDLEAELKCKCKSLSYIISHRTDPAVTSFQGWFNSPCVSGFPSFIRSCFVSWTLPSWGWHSDMLLTYPFIFQPWLSLFNP